MKGILRNEQTNKTNRRHCFQNLHWFDENRAIFLIYNTLTNAYNNELLEREIFIMPNTNKKYFS